MLKDDLRLKIKQKRNTLSPAEVANKSRKIIAHLSTLKVFTDAQTILFYISYGNEVFTHELIKSSLSTTKTVVVPKSNTSNYTLQLYILTDWNQLSSGAYHILEPNPDHHQQIAASTLDCILVPGVAFDLQGNRLGHGKGYYDRLLCGTPQIPHIGLAYECQLVDHIPLDDHDLPVHYLVTEDRIVECTIDDMAFS